MDSAPKSKRQRKKSKTKSSGTADDEILVEGQPTTVVAPKNARYAESSTLAIHSGTELGQDQALDLATREVEGNLDANLAELSLGQRLSALNGVDAEDKGSDSDRDKELGTSSKPSTRKPESPNIVPAHSLTRTLIQALHSSDSRLMETCLAHSDITLIRNTVRRLPPQLSLPLLLACMERLGRGARAANMKGGGGGASSQRGTVLINWIRTTLTAHSGHLMTMPDLVARLADLHATLTARLALHDSLLSLNGKLDTVLSQIEMRSSSGPASLVSKSRARDKARPPTRYVEGDSEEEDQMDVEPPIESGGEEGSVEDVELGEESSDGEETDEDEGEGESPRELDDESDGSGHPLEEYDDDDDDESE